MSLYPYMSEEVSLCSECMIEVILAVELMFNVNASASEGKGNLSQFGFD